MSDFDRIDENTNDVLRRELAPIGDAVVVACALLGVLLLVEIAHLVVAIRAL